MSSRLRPHFERRLSTPPWLPVAVPLLSVLAALVFTALVLLATGHDPWSTYSRLVTRGYTGDGALSNMLVTATPLLLTGLAAAVAFRMRVFNIGAEGQLYVGAIAAAGVGLALHGAPAALLVAAMVVAGALAGLAWAALPGVLRAYAHTNELITSLMLNYLGGLLLSYLIFDSHSYWRDLSSFTARQFPQGKTLPDAASWPSGSALASPATVLVLVVLAAVAAAGARAWRARRAGRVGIAASVLAVAGTIVLSNVTPAQDVAVPLGFGLGLAAAVAVFVLYRETRFGYEVRVVGDSLAAARYAGIDARRKIVAVMALSGALAGVAGASQIGDFSHVLDPRGLQQQALGYTGIVVAALARFHPLAVPVVALVLGGLTNAGFSLQGPDFPSGMVGILQGALLLCTLAGEVLARYRLRLGSVTPPPDPDDALPVADVAVLEPA